MLHSTNNTDSALFLCPLLTYTYLCRVKFGNISVSYYSME